MEQRYKLESVENIKNFIVGGKAIFTLESKVSGNWFTYRITKAKSETPLFFVSVLTGVNNESAYTYMGTIFENDGKLNFRLTQKSKIGKDALSFKAFDFFFNLLMKNRVHSDLNVYHLGVCARCGKTLTVPESLENGYGPECIKLSKKHKH